MPKLVSRILVSTVSLFSLAALCAAQEDGRRVAFIIGNNNYSLSPLRDAINDAGTMDKALRFRL